MGWVAKAKLAGVGCRVGGGVSRGGGRGVGEGLTLRASLSGTFLQTLPDLITPQKGHRRRSCPPTRSAPSERFGFNKTVEAT